jgi:hypothetical protein
MTFEGIPAKCYGREKNGNRRFNKVNGTKNIMPLATQRFKIQMQHS